MPQNKDCVLLRMAVKVAFKNDKTPNSGLIVVS